MNPALAHDHPLILLVDDDEHMLTSHAQTFARAACLPVGVTSSEDALAVLKDSPPVDIVLTDVNLAGTHGDKSGVTLARAIRRLHPDLPVVGYSACFSDDDLVEDRHHFDRIWSKGELGYKQLDELTTYCRDAALDGRRERLRRAQCGDADLAALDLRVSELTLRVNFVEEQSVTKDGVVWAVLAVLGALATIAALVVMLMDLH